jgi:hypothetical protein
MGKAIVFFLVLGLAVNLSVPTFYLRKAVNHESASQVKQFLGAPLESVDVPGGTSVWTYKTGMWRPYCVEYYLTFERNDGTTEPGKQVLSDWTWRMC